MIENPTNYTSMETHVCSVSYENRLSLNHGDNNLYAYNIDLIIDF